MLTTPQVVVFSAVGYPAHLGLLGLVFAAGGISCKAPALAWMSGLVCLMVTGAARAAPTGFCAGAGQQREGLRLQLPAAWGVPLGFAIKSMRLLAALVELVLQMANRLCFNAR